MYPPEKEVRPRSLDHTGKASIHDISDGKAIGIERRVTAAKVDTPLRVDRESLSNLFAADLVVRPLGGRQSSRLVCKEAATPVALGLSSRKITRWASSSLDNPGSSAVRQ